MTAIKRDEDQECALEACPFCGDVKSLEVALGLRKQYYVNCDKCTADGPLHDQREEAIAAWNCRALPAPSQPKEWDGRSIGESAPHAAYCDIAIQDAQVEITDKGERIWSYDDALFDRSLAGNGYKIVRIVDHSLPAPSERDIAEAIKYARMLVADGRNIYTADKVHFLTPHGLDTLINASLPAPSAWREALEALANAADDVGVKFFDTDTMDPLVDKMQAATQVVRAVLKSAPLAASPWLIWSNEHGAWWRPNSAGYTTFLGGAGRYSEQEAIDICRTARNGFTVEGVPTEIPVREIDVLRCLR